MSGNLRWNQDALGGLLFIVLGAIGLWLSSDLDVGTAASMGPGYLPNALAWGMIVLGCAIAVRGFVNGGEAIVGLHLRSVVLVLTSILSFSLLLNLVGLVVVAFLVVLIGAAAGREFRYKEVLLLGAGLAVASLFVFGYVLGLPVKVWPV